MGFQWFLDFWQWLLFRPRSVNTGFPWSVRGFDNTSRKIKIVSFPTASHIIQIHQLNLSNTGLTRHTFGEKTFVRDNIQSATGRILFSLVPAFWLVGDSRTNSAQKRRGKFLLRTCVSTELALARRQVFTHEKPVHTQWKSVRIKMFSSNQNILKLRQINKSFRRFDAWTHGRKIFQLQQHTTIPSDWCHGSGLGRSTPWTRVPHVWGPRAKWRPVVSRCLGSHTDTRPKTPRTLNPLLVATAKILFCFVFKFCFEMKKKISHRK